MKEKEEEIERQKNELIKKKDEEKIAQQQWEQNKEENKYKLQIKNKKSGRKKAFKMSK